MPAAPQDGTAIVVAIAVLQPASEGAAADYELRIAALDQVPDGAAFVAVASIPHLLDVVLALGAGLGPQLNA